MDKNAVRFFVLLVVISLVTRWLSLCVDILDLDEAGHIVGSWVLLDGKLLYTDFVDNKPPLLYVYYAFAQILFGRGMFAVHLLTALLTVPLTALALYFFWDRSFTGRYGAFLFLFYSSSFLAHDMLAANTELLMILPATWALTFIRTPEKAMRPANVAAASFLIGTAVLFKQQIVFWLPAVLVAIIIESIRNGKGRWFVLTLVSFFSFAVPLLITYAIFAVFDGEQALLQWTVINNFSYAANPITPAEAIGRAASYFLPFLIVTAPLWFYAARSSFGADSGGYRRLLALSLILFSIPPTLIGFRFFPHYFIQLYVPLALGAAPYVAALFAKAKGRGFVIYTLSLFVLCNVVNTILYFGDASIYRERDPVYRKVGMELRKSHCYAGATLFVWGYAPMFYYYSGLQPASRFAVLSHGGLTSYIPGNLRSVRSPGNRQSVLREESWKLLLQDLDRSRCTFLIDTAPAGIYRWDQYPMEDYPLLRDYVFKNFKLRATIDQVAIYERNSCQ